MFEKIRLYITDSVDEISHKVTWPSYGELQSSTVLVLVASIIFALLIGIVDLVFENGMSWFYRSF